MKEKEKTYKLLPEIAMEELKEMGGAEVGPVDVLFPASKILARLLVSIHSPETTRTQEAVLRRKARERN